MVAGPKRDRRLARSSSTSHGILDAKFTFGEDTKDAYAHVPQTHVYIGMDMNDKVVGPEGDEDIPVSINAVDDQVHLPNFDTDGSELNWGKEKFPSPDPLDDVLNGPIYIADRDKVIGNRKVVGQRIPRQEGQLFSTDYNPEIRSAGSELASGMHSIAKEAIIKDFPSHPRDMHGNPIHRALTLGRVQDEDGNVLDGNDVPLNITVPDVNTAREMLVDIDTRLGLGRTLRYGNPTSLRTPPAGYNKEIDSLEDTSIRRSLGMIPSHDVRSLRLGEIDDLEEKHQQTIADFDRSMSNLHHQQFSGVSGTSPTLPGIDWDSTKNRDAE